jgi:uncharacterized OB-fold protein
MTRMVPLPYMLDFLPQEDEAHTRIHPFFDNLRQGRFTTTRCSKCGEVLWQPRVVCPHCNSDELEWVDLPKEGTVYSHTAMVLGAPMGFEEDVPFVIAIVELDLGGGRVLRLLSRIDDARYEDVSIGDRVHLKVLTYEDGRVHYRFTPRGGR